MTRDILLIALTLALVLSTLSCGGRTGVRTTVYYPTQGGVVDVSFFYDELAPYGAWHSVAEYGWVWSPGGMAFGWRPYTNGYWVYTDYGWTWVSNERWGWGPFHYGRWSHHRVHGWIWIPGTVWGPAWVSWRRGPGWVGWAPLGPEVGWGARGLAYRDRDLDRFIHPDSYCFVNERRFAARDVHQYIEAPTRNTTIVTNTTNITNITVINNRVVNTGVPVDQYERETGQQIIRRRLVDADSVTTDRGDKLKGNDVVLFRPKLEDRAPTRTPKTAAEQLDKQQRKLQQQQAEQQRLQEKQQRKAQQRQAEEQRKKEKRQNKNTKPNSSPG